MKKICCTILCLLLPVLAFSLPSMSQIKKHGIIDIAFLNKVATKAKKGDAFSEAQLGEGYINGSIGYFPNFDKGLYWLNKAAEQGDPIAYINLAELYNQGAGVEQDSAKAKKYYELAFKGLKEKIANKDYPENALPLLQYNLAKIYFWGLGDATQPDMKKAFELIHASAEAGFGHSIKAVALMYRYALGTKYNPQEAFKWEKILANVGVRESQYIVGWAYLKGVGTSKNAKEALYWIRRSAQNYYYPAIQLLVALRDEGRISKIYSTEERSYKSLIEQMLSQRPYVIR